MKLVFLNNEVYCATNNLDGMGFGENEDNVVITTLDGKYDHTYEYTYDADTLIATQGELKVVDPAVEQQLLDDYNKIKYKDERANAYPDIKEQLDKIYHEGIDAWKTTIKAVKDAHPKP